MGTNLSDEPKDEITLRETAVTDIDGVRIGLANVWDESFSDDNGRHCQGIRGTICLMFEDSAEDLDIRVALGDEIEFRGDRYRVVHISAEEPRGSLTLEQVPPAAATQHAEPADHLSPRRANWVDFMLPIPFFLLPYAASSARLRAVLAAGCLVAWFVATRPSWRALQGFYASSLLLLHFLTWTIIAIIASFLG